jgi:uncharacterized protein YndB with AHSA1/START domain
VGVAHWKAHFTSGPTEVYRALSTPLGRSRYWAESADERDEVIRFVLPDGRTDDSRIEQAVRDELYQLRYFGRSVTFTLTADESGGTDLTLSCEDPGGQYDADHVALLLRLKASVDFGVDLRNHDRSRTAHYADS